MGTQGRILGAGASLHHRHDCPRLPWADRLARRAWFHPDQSRIGMEPTGGWYGRTVMAQEGNPTAPRSRSTLHFLARL